MFDENDMFDCEADWSTVPYKKDEDDQRFKWINSSTTLKFPLKHELMKNALADGDGFVKCFPRESRDEVVRILSDFPTLSQGAKLTSARMLQIMPFVISTDSTRKSFADLRKFFNVVLVKIRSDTEEQDAKSRSMNERLDQQPQGNYKYKRPFQLDLVIPNQLGHCVHCNHHMTYYEDSDEDYDQRNREHANEVEKHNRKLRPQDKEMRLTFYQRFQQCGCNQEKMNSLCGGSPSVNDCSCSMRWNVVNRQKLLCENESKASRTNAPVPFLNQFARRILDAGGRADDSMAITSGQTENFNLMANTIEFMSGGGLSTFEQNTFRSALGHLPTNVITAPGPFQGRTIPSMLHASAVKPGKVAAKSSKAARNDLNLDIRTGFDSAAENVSDSISSEMKQQLKTYAMSMSRDTDELAKFAMTVFQCTDPRLIDLISFFSACHVGSEQWSIEEIVQAFHGQYFR